MTETPTERRDRIDGARREQAELNRQIGQEFANLLVRPSAAEAWTEFQDALRAGEDARTPVLPNCRGREDEFRDYSPFDVPSPGRAKMMCATCPFSTLSGDGTCGTFATAERPATGVWDGIVYGRLLADKERREIIKQEKEDK